MIPVNEPVFVPRDLELVTECLESGWVSSASAFVDRFEVAWAAYCGRRYGVAVSSGTTALQTAVACLDLEAGDEVILPAFTIISCVLAVLQAGGVPVLVDADPETWCLDVGQVRARIGPRTRAIMAVPIYGHPVDMDPLLRVAEDHDLAVIEDAAEAHGAEYLTGRDGGQSRWRRAGSFGQVSCFSFYANKLVTTGEGGMVLTDDPRLAERARALRNLCFQPGRRFYHEELGFNFRLSGLQAALGLGQIERMPDIVARKRQVGAAYRRGLAATLGLALQAEREWARSVFWMNGLLLADERGLTAAEFAATLATRGVETRPFFLGMHEQPALLERGLFRGERYPVTEHLARYGLCLPSGLALTDTQVHDVCAAVRAALR
jgi:perosamine synthetase